MTTANPERYTGSGHMTLLSLVATDPTHPCATLALVGETVDDEKHPKDTWMRLFTNPITTAHGHNANLRRYGKDNGNVTEHGDGDVISLLDRISVPRAPVRPALFQLADLQSPRILSLYIVEYFAVALAIRAMFCPANSPDSVSFCPSLTVECIKPLPWLNMSLQPLLLPMRHLLW